MTNGINSRLDEIENILASTARYAEMAHEGMGRLERMQIRSQAQIDQLSLNIDATRTIADSNARAIEAWSQTIQDDRADREEEDSRLSVRLREFEENLTQMIGGLAHNLAESNQRFEVMLADTRSDRQSIRELQSQFNEMQQDIRNIVLEIQADRAAIKELSTAVQLLTQIVQRQQEE